MEGLSNSYSSSSLSSTSSFGSSMVSPKSPPPCGGMDLYWKRKQLVKVQVLEREIGHLQDELKSIDGLQPASRCCKDLDDFIGAKADPLIVPHQEPKESCCSRRELWQKLCCGVSWICCFCNCQLCPGKPNCHACCSSSSDSQRHSCCLCLRKPTCRSCRKPPKLSCPKCTCCCLKLCPCKCVTTKSCHCRSNCSNSCCCL